MVVIGLIAMYTLLNAGNPDGLLRPFFPDPMDDIYIAMVASVAVFVLGFVVFFTRDQEGFRNLVQMNGERIRQLRKKGKSEPEIADSILAAMGSYSGYRYHLARRKLLVYLAEFH
jgi:hypothetical protein